MQQKQAHHHSFIEVVLNTFTGMVLAFCITQTIGVWVLGIPISPGQNVWLTIILTFVSIIRGFIWRKVFDNIHVKRVSKRAKRCNKCRERKE